MPTQSIRPPLPTDIPRIVFDDTAKEQAMVGKQLGAYQIVKELAEGGMGCVYEGICLTQHTPVAIKTLRKEMGERREDVGRFIREASIYKRLIHPNLMRFYAFGFDAEMGFYLVTELMVGRDLEELLFDQNDRPLPMVEALDIALQVCAGMAAAHDEGIVHRDLKPGNIFIVEQDGAEIAKVFDFGIAKMLESSEAYKLTITGAALGTPLYMAPEQIRGDQATGPAADIYALGVIIFQMIAGTPPFTGATHMSILADHIRTPPPLLRQYIKALAGSEIETLVDQMLAKEPSDRPRDLQQVKERLWQARHHHDHGTNPSQGTLMAMPNFSELQAMFDTQNDLPEAAATQEIPVAVLRLKQEPHNEEIAWLLPGETLTIGSTAPADIRLRKQGILPLHAEFQCAPGGWITVRSLDGAAIRVNGAIVNHMMLQSGDWITLGQVEIQLHCF